MLRRINKLFVGLGVLSVFLLTGCNPTQKKQMTLQTVKQDMAAFDRVYIPALSYTSLENVEASQQSMVLLVDNWKRFKAKYEHLNGNDPQWTASLDTIQTLIDGADQVVRSGNHILTAHQNYLEEIRIVFMHLRERNNIHDYFIDALTRFHQPMEDIVLAAKGKTVQTITAEDISKINNILPVALEKFEAIKQTEPDKDVFGFDEAKVSRIRQLIAQEDQALKTLKAALTKNDKAAIIQAAVGIKSNFAKLFKQFGDFKN